MTPDYMKKVLIISYYWPPTGGSGVQRWVKFTKYLPEYGWLPVIYTPENPEQMSVDHSLLKDVPEEAVILKRKILEPYSLYRFFNKKGGAQAANPIGKKSKKSAKERLSLLIRANLFVPDPRSLWIKPSVRFLKKHLRKEPVDLIVSTGPPHSMHLIAKRLHKDLSIPWVADFRDPWTGIFYFKHLNMFKSVRRRHKKLELSVIESADRVVVVSEGMREEFGNILKGSGLSSSKIGVITNGFDPDDFSADNLQYEDLFVLTHTGLLTEEGNCDVLWRVLTEMCRENPEFKKRLLIRIIGKVDSSVKESMEEAGLGDNTIYMGYLDHNSVTQWQQTASLLLLPLRKEPESKGILTGKFFEYLAARREILAFGPTDGDLAHSLRETGSGSIVEFDDYHGAMKAVEQAYQKYLACGNGPENGIPYSDKTDKYSRRGLTRSMVDIFNSLRFDNK